MYHVEMIATYPAPRNRPPASDYRAVRVAHFPAAVCTMDQHWGRIGRRTGTRLDVTVTDDGGRLVFRRTMRAGG
jgi:hypothetical protein